MIRRCVMLMEIYSSFRRRLAWYSLARLENGTVSALSDSLPFSKTWEGWGGRLRRYTTPKRHANKPITIFPGFTSGKVAAGAKIPLQTDLQAIKTRFKGHADIVLRTAGIEEQGRLREKEQRDELEKQRVLEIERLEKVEKLRISKGINNQALAFVVP